MQDAQEKKYITMTQAPVRALVCRLAVPTIISMLVTSFYNMADTYFVGKIGTSASAAVGVAFSMMSIIQAVGFFFGHGSGNYISRALGHHDFEDARQMASTGFFCALIAGTLIMISGLIFLEPLVYALGSTPTIAPYTRDYLGIILIGAPFMTASLVLNNQLRFQGSAIYAMAGIASGAVLNIALDPLLIFSFNMGIAGAALATIISQFVGFCLLLIGCSKGGNLRVSIRLFRPTPERLKAIVSGGTPSLFRQGINSVSTIILNFCASGYGDAAIAAMSIVTRIMMFANSCLIGFGQGFQPVCGFNYGARRYDRVREAFYFCVKLSTVVLAVLAVIGLIFAPQIVEIFRKGDPDVISIGQVALRMQCITFPLAAWVVLSNMMLQTIAMTGKASFLAIARQGLFFIPALLVLFKLFGLWGVESAQAVADLISFACAVPISRGVLLQMKREMEKMSA